MELMFFVNQLFRVVIPNYFRRLPIPKTFDGFFKLSYTDWISLILFIHIFLFVIVAIIKLILPKPATKVNESIQKEDPKVVNLVEIEDLGSEKTSYCRCWKSKKFPLCDGSHNDHNKQTGDNVGPVVLKRRDK